MIKEHSKEYFEILDEFKCVLSMVRCVFNVTFKSTLHDTAKLLLRETEDFEPLESDEEE